MARPVVWSERAIEDLESIAAYIALDSEAYSASVVRDVLKKVRSLADFPAIGRVVPEFDDVTIREIFSYSYRIVYRVESNVVTVAAVVHGKRLLDMELNP